MSDCDGDCATCLDVPGPESTTPDGIFIKQMELARAGDRIRQHSHLYAHTTYLATGKIRVWTDKTAAKDYSAPAMIEIPAMRKHEFMALSDNTLVLCIHKLNGTAAPVVHERAEVV